MSVNTYLPPSPVIPMTLLIEAITQSNPMMITVFSVNTYMPKMLVHLIVPPTYGMTQANDLTLEVLEVSELNITVKANSIQFDPFIIPSSYQERPASLSPAGSRNLQFGNFTNKVPFQSVGNFGN